MTDRTEIGALAKMRNDALEDAARVCREEMSRARNLAAALDGTASAPAGELVTLGRQDSASRILAAIRALKTP